MTESPSLMTVLPACLKVCCNNMGSNAGSSSSATFSSKQGFPKRTAFSKLRRKSLSVSLTTSKPLSFSWCMRVCHVMHIQLCCTRNTMTYAHYYLTTPRSLTMFLTHLLACPWGSIKSGHLRENWTMIPFSTDRVSLGRPAICQFLILTGSARIENRLAPSVWGTLEIIKDACHDSTSATRYSPWVWGKKWNESFDVEILIYSQGHTCTNIGCVTECANTELTNRVIKMWLQRTTARQLRILNSAKHNYANINFLNFVRWQIAPRLTVNDPR